MGTPSGQYVQLTLCCFLMSAQHYPYAFYAMFVLVQFNLLFVQYIWLTWTFFLPFLPHISCMCVHILYAEMEDSSWTDHLCPFFLQASLSLSCSLSLSSSLSLSGRLKHNWSLGGSREEPGKGGTKGRPSAAITTLHLLSSLPPVLPSLGPLASLPSLHWPAPQIKTSDKKMGSLKKGEKARERERRKSLTSQEEQSDKASVVGWQGPSVALRGTVTVSTWTPCCE